MEIDKGDYPVPRALRESEEKLASCYKSIQHYLVLTQPPTTGTLTTQIETEDQATQDNTPPTPSDTARHPVAHAEPELDVDFEHDPELDSKDQNILAIETTETLDNYIDNIDPTFDNSLDSTINDCIDTKQTVDNSDIGDPTESKTETIDDNMHDQTDNMDNEDQDISEITQTDNNTLDFNSPIDFNDHNSSMKTQAETDNSHKESEPIESEDESDPRNFEPESIDIDSDVGSEHDFENLETMRPQHKQEIRTMDFGPNLHTQTSECADCPEPNTMQQPQSNNRQNNSIESAIEAPTQTLKSLLSSQKSHSYSKPKQPFHHKRVKPHARPSFKPTYRPHNNKGQYFNINSKYQKQTAHTNSIEDYEVMYLDMCKNFRARIPARKPIPLFSYG